MQHKYDSYSHTFARTVEKSNAKIKASFRQFQGRLSVWLLCSIPKSTTTVQDKVIILHSRFDSGLKTKITLRQQFEPAAYRTQFNLQGIKDHRVTFKNNLLKLIQISPLESALPHISCKCLDPVGVFPFSEGLKDTKGS